MSSGGARLSQPQRAARPGRVELLALRPFRHNGAGKLAGIWPSHALRLRLPRAGGNR